MADRIIELLNRGNISFNEMAKEIDLPGYELQELLQKMEEELIVVVTPSGKYSLLSHAGLFKGTLNYEDGLYFVKLGKNIFNINEKDLHDAIPGDTVAIEQTSKIGKIRYAKVVRVKPSDKLYTGTIQNVGDKSYLVVDTDEKFGVVLDDYYVDGTRVGFVKGEKINDRSSIPIYKVRILQEFGNKDDLDTERKVLLFKHKVPVEFPPEVEEAVSMVPTEVTEEFLKEHSDIQDLRDQTFFTIDPTNAKDFDDSISVKKIRDNMYILDVAIADVTTYADEHSVIFKNAIERGISYYLGNGNVPMISRKLSNGICSLNPDVDRLALNFRIAVDTEHYIFDMISFKSVIHSRKRMTYNDVNKIVEEGIIPEGYEPFVGDIKLLEELTGKLWNYYYANGHVDFGLPETIAILDENHEPIRFEKYYVGKAQKMIEASMLLPGVLTAKSLAEAGYNFVHRVHEDANQEKVNAYIKYASTLGVDASILTSPTNNNFGIYLNSIRFRDDFETLSRELLKCTARSKYSIEKLPHFALGFDEYCQVTSDMRRGGDTINHVIIKAMNEGRPNPFSKTQLEKMCKNLTTREQTADTVSECDLRMNMAKYMQSHIGEEFTGHIISINDKKMEVELDNNVLVSISKKDLPKDFMFNPEIKTLSGLGNSVTYSLGKQIDVVIGDNVYVSSGYIPAIPKQFTMEAPKQYVYSTSTNIK